VEGTAQHSLDDHRGILELIERGDYNEAKEEMRKHLRFTVDSVQNRIFSSNKACVGQPWAALSVGRKGGEEEVGDRNQQRFNSLSQLHTEKMESQVTLNGWRGERNFK
jgi:hypothetical protein